MDANSTPRVSIIMPTYKRLTYIREAIDSALAQTMGDFELVVSDNGMTQDVADLAAGYGDPRIRYRTNGSNVGPMRNAQYAYMDGRAPLLTTLHDDDAWEPTFLERLVTPLEADPTLTLAFSDHWVMDSHSVVQPGLTEQNSRIWGRAELREGVIRPFIRQAVIDRALPVAMSTVFRKSAIDWDDFPAEMDPNYDLWIGYLAARGGAGAYYAAERLTRYRFHESSMTSGVRYDKPLVYCYSRFLADENLADYRRQIAKEAANFQVGLAMQQMQQGDRSTARRSLVKVMRTAPSPRAAAALALAATPLPASSVIARARALRRHAPVSR